MKKLLTFTGIWASLLIGIVCLFIDVPRAQVNLPLLGVGGGSLGWCGQILQTGLVNCWPFDTNHTTSSLAKDVIGGKDATMSNFSLNGSGPGTNLNNAGVFNGTSTKGTTSLANVPTSAFSVGMWVFLTTDTGAGFIFNNGNPNDANKGFMIEQPNGFFALQAYSGNGTTTTLVQSGAFSSSAWHCFVVTYDGTTLTPYIDSSAGSTGPLTSPLVNNGTNTIGFGEQMPPDSGNWYANKLAGVVIYNSALSAGAVSTFCGIT